MAGIVVIDANLLVLLVVGTASKDYIPKHRRLAAYTADDFELLGLIISEFSDIVLVPHLLAEASSLARKIENPARGRIQDALQTLIETVIEIPVSSRSGVQRDEFNRLGLTDAVILHLCSMDVSGLNPTLVTVDSDLANSANSLGYSVIDYKQQYQGH